MAKKAKKSSAKGPKPKPAQFKSSKSKSTAKRSAATKSGSKRPVGKASKPAAKSKGSVKSAIGKASLGKPPKPRPVASKTKASKPHARKSPYPVNTGSGSTAQEVGESLVEMFNRGEFKQIEERWWSPAIESIEGTGMAWAGRQQVDAKNAWWSSQNEILGASAEGPFVGATGFAVKFRMEVAERTSGNRTQMAEVGVYTVRDGKIVREEFMYEVPKSV